MVTVASSRTVVMRGGLKEDLKESLQWWIRWEEEGDAKVSSLGGWAPWPWGMVVRTLGLGMEVMVGDVEAEAFQGCPPGTTLSTRAPSEGQGGEADFRVTTPPGGFLQLWSHSPECRSCQGHGQKE